MKKAFITGISGQDGSYLAELLIDKNYEVHGLVRKLPSGENLESFFRIKHILTKIFLHEGDITDESSISRIIREIKPDEIYCLAAVADPLVSPLTERNILWNNINGTYIVLCAIREYSSKTKLFFASSGLIFGNPNSSPQDESTAKEPITPYGIAKAAGFNLVRMFREAYGIFACSGILYNHESPRRDVRFLPKKITKAAAHIKKGLQKELRLGDIEAVRDWGFAGDYVEAMWLMLQQPNPEDYVIGTGNPHTVRDILEIAFCAVQLDWRNYVVVDPDLVRPRENLPVVANPLKAKEKLGWRARTEFDELIKLMVLEDLSI